MGIATMQSPSGELMGMGGAGPGYAARMFLLPEDDLPVVLGHQDGLTEAGQREKGATHDDDAGGSRPPAAPRRRPRPHASIVDIALRESQRLLTTATDIGFVSLLPCPPSMDLLRHVGFFVAVADHLHLGRAAAEIGMAQPPLPQGIQRLERHLGLRLFDRDTRRVALTSAGADLLPAARQLLAQADSWVNAAHALGKGRRVVPPDESRPYGVVGRPGFSWGQPCIPCPRV